jgi:hypothetical protein
VQWSLDGKWTWFLAAVANLPLLNNNGLHRFISCGAPSHATAASINVSVDDNTTRDNPKHRKCCANVEVRPLRRRSQGSPSERRIGSCLHFCKRRSSFADGVSSALTSSWSSRPLAAQLSDLSEEVKSWNRLCNLKIHLRHHPPLLRASGMVK